MRVCIVTPTVTRTDGQARVNYEIARYLAQQGHSVTLMMAEIDSELEIEANILIYPISIPSWVPTALLRAQIFAWKTRQALLHHSASFDIIHLNGALSYYAADVNTSHFVHSNWIKSPWHTSRVFHGLYGVYHWLYTTLNAFWERRAYRSAQQVVAVSELVKDSLIAEIGIEPDKVNVIPNGVDIQEFRPLLPSECNRIRDELGIPKEIFLVLFVGDLKTNRKNLNLVLKAMTQVEPNIHLAVIGSTHRSPYPEKVQQLNLAERVHFLGHRSDIATLMRGADVFVLPSYYDTFALVILEALASAIPVITTPSVGASTFVLNGENGFLLRDSEDVDGMVLALHSLVKNRNFSQQMGRNGRVVAEGLSWESMASQYESLYKRVVDSKNGSSSSSANSVPVETTG